MLRPGQAIALCVLALLTIGVVMVNSAGMNVDPKRAVTVTSIVFSRSAAYMVVALAAMIVCTHLPIRRLTRLFERAPAPTLPLAAESVPADDARFGSGEWVRSLRDRYVSLWPMWVCVGGLLAALALVYIPGVGRAVNGSHRWITLRLPGLESIQPSELAKWGLVMLVAWYGATQARLMHRFWIGLTPALAAAGVLSIFIIKEDLGTGVLLGVVTCVMLVAAGARIWQIALVAPLPLAAVAAAIATSPYRRDRMLAFLDPYADPQGIGYHMIQSMVAVANGNVFGRGLGFGLQKFGYLPEDKTDFLFAIICEELGIAGAAAVLALLGGLMWACWSVIKREHSPLLRLLGLGIVATVGIQALINLAVVTGLGPTKGIALPLLSSGGTGWILTAASLGLVIAMDRTYTPMARAAMMEEDGELPMPEEGLDEALTTAAVEIEATPVIAEPTIVEPKTLPVEEIAVVAEAPGTPQEPVSEESHALADALETLALDIGPTPTIAAITDGPAVETGAIVTPDSQVAHDQGQGLLFSDERADTPLAEFNADIIVTEEARDWTMGRSSEAA